MGLGGFWARLVALLAAVWAVSLMVSSVSCPEVEGRSGEGSFCGVNEPEALGLQMGWTVTVRY